jgi:hypothetical protein
MCLQAEYKLFMVLRSTGYFFTIRPKLNEIKGRIILKLMGSVYQIHVTQARDKWPLKEFPAGTPLSSTDVAV